MVTVSFQVDDDAVMPGQAAAAVTANFAAMRFVINLEVISLA
jgi:hypothetical protein